MKERIQAAIAAAEKRGEKVVGVEYRGSAFRLEYESDRLRRAPEQTEGRGNDRQAKAHTRATKARKRKGSIDAEEHGEGSDPAESTVGGDRVTHKFAPWAYSKLKAFETCPKQFYHMKVAKTYEEPDSEHLRYGNEFHKAAELFVAGKEDLPKAFDFARPVLTHLRDREGEKHCELKLGLTEGLDPCGFFDKGVWWRGVVDYLNLKETSAQVVDYKTSKSSRYADKGQLELMAMAVFKHFPQVKKVHASLLFVIADDMVKDTYVIEDEPKLWESWLRRYQTAEKAMKANVFNPKPSGLCARHCQVLECAHNGRS